MIRQVIGIDFGTTFSSISYMPIGSNDPPQLLQFPGARFHVPTLLSVDPDDDTLVEWGWKAQAALGSAHKNKVERYFKRTLGEDPRSSEWVRMYLCALNEFIREKMGNLEHMKSEEFITAIGAPAKWSTEQKETLKGIAEDAGFPEVRIIDEPVAAMHNLRCKPGIKFAFGDRPETFMVIDFGGGTLDICIVKTQELGRDPKILAVEGDAAFGGKDFDDLLQAWFLRESEIDPGHLTSGERFHLTEQIQTYKENMASVFRKTAVECVHEEKIHLSSGAHTFETSKNAFRNRCKEYGLLEKFETAVNQALVKCGLQAKDIKRVILTGGSCGFHFVRPIVAKQLGVAESELLETNTPYTDVANGLSVCVGLSPDPPTRDGVWLDFRFNRSKQWERKVLLSPGRVSRVPRDSLYLGEINGSRTFVRATLEFSWMYGRSETSTRHIGASILKIHLRSNRPNTQVVRNLISVIRREEVKALTDTYKVFMVTCEPNDLQGIHYSIEIQDNRGEITTIQIRPNEEYSFGAFGHGGLIIRPKKAEKVENDLPTGDSEKTIPTDVAVTADPSGEDADSTLP